MSVRWLNFRKVFFTVVQISKKKVPNHASEYYSLSQGRDLAPSFGDLSQSERLSEIKPSLELLQNTVLTKRNCLVPIGDPALTVLNKTKWIVHV